MTREPIEFLSAVLLVSRESAAALPISTRTSSGSRSNPRGTGSRCLTAGCNLGEVHFAIHPVETFPDGRSGVGSVKLAFTTFDLDALVRRLQKGGVTPSSILRETPASSARLRSRDPDGNLIEFTELCDEWFQSLEERRVHGADVVARWRKARSAAERGR